MTVYHWLALFVAVNVLDAALTLYAMRQGASEVNPLMRAAMRVMPPAVALLAIKGAYVVAVAVMLAEAAPWLPWLTAFFAAICAWNAGQIVKLRNPT
jgi:hypothetical protein